MLPPIVCNCGLPLGDVARVFLKERAELLEKKAAKIGKDVDPNNVIYMLPVNDVDMVEIFEKLGIKTLCCRKEINTNMNFSDYY